MVETGRGDLRGREQDAKKFTAGMRDIGDLLGETATAVKQDDETNGKRLVKQLSDRPGR